MQPATFFKMNYFVVVVLAFAASSNGLHTDPTNLELNNKPNATVECIRGIIINGDNEMDIDVLDPLIEDDEVYDIGNLTDNVSTGTLALKNFKSEGLAGFITTVLDTEILSDPKCINYTIGIKWPKITFDVDYDIDIKYKHHNISGKGHLRKIDTKQAIGMNLQVVQDKYEFLAFNVTLNAGETKFEIDEFKVDGRDVGPFIGFIIESIPDIVEEYQTEIDVFLSEAILKALNKIDSEAYEKISDFISRKCKVTF